MFLFSNTCKLDGNELVNNMANQLQAQGGICQVPHHRQRQVAPFKYSFGLHRLRRGPRRSLQDHRQSRVSPGARPCPGSGQRQKQDARPARFFGRCPKQDACPIRFLGRCRKQDARPTRFLGRCSEKDPRPTRFIGRCSEKDTRPEQERRQNGTRARVSS